MLMRRALLAAAALALGPACGGLATLGPTAAGEGIDFYIHAGFAGSSQSVNVDVRDLAKVEGPCARGEEGEPPTWSDCISSVRVHTGWSATLYKDRDFKGASTTLTADAQNLRDIVGPCDGSFNDCVSSIRVSRMGQ